MISRVLRRVKSLDQRLLRGLILLSVLGGLGWVLAFSRHHFPRSWEEPLLAAAAVLIGMKLWVFIGFTAAGLAISAFRWLRPKPSIASEAPQNQRSQRPVA